MKKPPLSRVESQIEYSMRAATSAQDESLVQLDQRLKKRVAWALIFSVLANFVLWRVVSSIAQLRQPLRPQPIEITRLILTPQGTRATQTVAPNQIAKRVAQIRQTLRRADENRSNENRSKENRARGERSTEERSMPRADDSPRPQRDVNETANAPRNRRPRRARDEAQEQPDRSQSFSQETPPTRSRIDETRFDSASSSPSSERTASTAPSNTSSSHSVNRGDAGQTTGRQSSQQKSTSQNSTSSTERGTSSASSTPASSASSNGSNQENQSAPDNRSNNGFGGNPNGIMSPTPAPISTPFATPIPIATPRATPRPTPFPTTEPTPRAIIERTPRPTPRPTPEPERTPRPMPKGATREARATRQVNPEIPDSLRDEQFKSSVRVRVVVHADGSFDASLRGSSGNSRIDDLALRALQRWRWKPALKDGEPIESTQLFRLDFSVE